MRDDEDISAFVAGRWRRLVRAVVLMGCPPSEAEDVVQAALVRCLQHWGRVRAADDVDAYVHRILVNTLASARRRRWTGERATARVPDLPADDASADVDRVDAVVRSLAKLTDDQRTAVVLRYYANLTEAQMAAVLGVATGTVKSRLSRALDALSKDPQLADLRGAP